MSNWKERAEVEIASQRANEEARLRQQILAIEAEDQTRVQREQGLRKIGISRLAQFDALGITQKLTDINGDVWKGLGELRTVRREISPEGLITAILGLYFNLETNASNVVEETVPIEKRVFGSYSTSYDTYSGGEDGGGYAGSVREHHFGWHTEVVGHKIVDYVERLYNGLWKLEVGYQSEIGSETARIVIDNDLIQINSSINPRDNWEITHGYLDRGEGKHFSDRDLSYVRGIVVKFPVDDFDNGLLSNFIDDALTKSCVAILPYVDGWVTGRKEVNAKIIDIQSRIGQVRPVK